MRGFRYIVMLMALVGAMSCVQADIDEPVIIDSGKDIQVVGHVSSFSDRNVSSRALKVGDESNTASMCLAIFNGSGYCVKWDYQYGNPTFTIKSNQLQDGTSLYMFANVPEDLFSGLKVKSDQEEGDTIDSFLNTLNMTVDSIDIPTFIDDEGEEVRCFPMYGVERINGSIPSVIQIPLESIYAKVVVNILSKPDQAVAGHTPASFTLTGYEVHNVVNSVDFKHKKDVEDYSDTTTVSEVIYEGSNITSKLAQSDKEASFYFYLPERYLKPKTSADDYAYPFKKDTYGEDVDKDQNGIRDEDENYRQRYKPELVKGQKATFVRFFGEYLDHQGHNWNVSYDIYVGNDNYSNFDIEANTQYNNYVTIRGISNSNDQTDSDQTDSDKTIAIDHRVNIERVSPITINLRRETLLDSHFEVRPLRIRKNAGFQGADLSNAKVKVEVVYNNDDPAKNWVGIERSFGEGKDNVSEGDYLQGDGVSAGKRKYFTTNLTTETLAGDDGQSVVIPVSDKDETIWIYVDECTDTGDDVRSVNIRISFSLDGVNYDSNQSTDYTICQRKLFPVATTRNADKDGVGGDFTYLIEYHEEYLHNYDAYDEFGQTDEGGMEFGLNEVQLSGKYEAFILSHFIGEGWADGLGNFTSRQNQAFATLSPKPEYDFYLYRDIRSIMGEHYVDDYYDQKNGYYAEKLKVQNYRGRQLNQYIADTLVTNSTYKGHQKEEEDDKCIAKINKITLNQSPKSAFAYCYNKNKRNANGEVVDMKWYLPAIDEVEDIVESAHGRFVEFQDNMYWSCQPAYVRTSVELQRYNWVFSWNKVNGNIYYGSYFSDDIDRARATKAIRENGVFKEAPSSGADASQHRTGNIYISLLTSKATEWGTSTEINSNPYHEGNLSRTGTKARVRCVRVGDKDGVAQ